MEILLNIDSMVSDGYVGIWSAKITKLGGKAAPVLDCVVVLLKDTVSFVYKRSSAGIASLTVQEAMGASRDQLCRVTKSVHGLQLVTLCEPAQAVYLTFDYLSQNTDLPEAKNNSLVNRRPPVLDNDDRPDVLFFQACEYAEFKTALEFCKETGSSTHKVDDISEEIVNKLLQSGQQAIKNAKRYLGKSKILDREAVAATEIERIRLCIRVAPADASVSKLLVFLNDVYFTVDCELEEQRVTISNLNMLTEIVQLQMGPKNSLIIA